MNNHINPIRMVVLALCICISMQMTAQTDPHPIATEIAKFAQEFQQLDPRPLLQLSSRQQELGRSTEKELGKAQFFHMEAREVARLLAQPEELLSLSLPTADGQQLELQLTRAQVFSDEFQLKLASDPTQPQAYQQGLYYWGLVNGEEHSLAALAIHNGEIMGTIATEGKTYTLGRLQEGIENTHVLYRKEEMKQSSPFNCGTDDTDHFIGAEGKGRSAAEKDANNCVRMYIEVDHDIVLEKGSVAAATDYVSGVFSQVAILYANEGINFVINEMLVWDVVDPYTGPGTSNYLYQFRDRLDGNYNGDLAHLVGNDGSGGVAYVDVLCNKRYGVGYSGIGSTYQNVPTYSWTVEVLTHEIGHNLGSPHTHACAWNGNNTAIDGCGPAAGISDGCDAEVPAKGTIMSYCHLVSGVGIDFNLGFGQQPGDLIRDRVYNAGCLSACAPVSNEDAGITNIITPTGSICAGNLTPQVQLTNFGSTTLTSVTIQYRIDNGATQNFAWTGNLAAGAATNVSLPTISFGLGSHTFHAETDNPNGSTDGNATNDAATSSFNRINSLTFYRDADGDGYGNPTQTAIDCTQPAGYVSDNTDCNDNDAGAYPGAPCNDGDDCTTNDVLDSNCDCAGSPTVDNDNDGFCAGQDPDDNDPCVPDANGGNCAPCSDLFTDGFEAGFGNWIDGGSDSDLSTAYANSGSYSVRLRDNSGRSSSTYTQPMDLSAHASVTISFSYYPNSMESGEDFMLEVSTNGGSSYNTYRRWVSGTDFNNNTRYQESVEISSSNLSSSTVFRIRCDASTNSDQIYLDDIVISSCTDTGGCVAGTACDDGDDCTTNDVLDSNCNCAGTPAGGDQTYYADNDGDGYGNPNQSVVDCTAPNGYVSNNTDCNDNSAAAYPGAPCNDGDDCTTNDIMDSNCDCAGTPSTGDQTYYADNDGDGYGNPNQWVVDCAAPNGYVSNNTDCNDSDAGAYPGAPCNDGDDCTINDVMDSNCDCAGTPTADNDGDGYCAAQDPDDNDSCVPDASGSECAPCSDLYTDGFESGFGNWIDGGSDCSLSTAYANNGNYSVRLRDNSGRSSAIYTNPLDLSAYGTVSISFSYFPVSMESGEDFMLEVSTDGGSDFTTYRRWIRGTDFSNNIRYQESVEITGISLTSATVFRIRCDASTNSDNIYLDDIVISSCPANLANSTPGDATLPQTGETSAEISSVGVTLYPNPARDQAVLEFDVPSVTATVTVYDVLGKTVGRYLIADQPALRLPVHEWGNESQMYIITIEIDGQQPLVRKLMITK